MLLNTYKLFAYELFRNKYYAFQQNMPSQMVKEGKTIVKNGLIALRFLLDRTFVSFFRFHVKRYIKPGYEKSFFPKYDDLPIINEFINNNHTIFDEKKLIDERKQALSSQKNIFKRIIGRSTPIIKSLDYLGFRGGEYWHNSGAIESLLNYYLTVILPIYIKVFQIYEIGKDNYTQKLLSPKQSAVIDPNDPKYTFKKVGFDRREYLGRISRYDRSGHGYIIDGGYGSKEARKTINLCLRCENCGKKRL